MATNRKPPIDAAKVLNKAGYAAELARLRKSEAESRNRATDAGKILDPSDVRGEYDASRLLITTLGGVPRVLTLDDLRQFSAQARKLGKKFKGGITAQQVIDLSLPVDRKRANEQIRTASLVRAQQGVLHFITNAGPDSDRARHHVNVQFPAFEAFGASPKKADTLAKAMLEGSLRFECDCGRHRFWLRYCATIGGYNYGRPEPGFPRVRNPGLSGVACKHALRVMQAIRKDVFVRTTVAQMIAKAQRQDQSGVTVANKLAREQAAQQLAQAHHKKNTVRTTAEMGPAAVKRAAAQARAVAQAAKAAAARAATRAATAAIKKATDALAAAYRAGALTKAQYEAAVAATQKT